MNGPTHLDHPYGFDGRGRTATTGIDDHVRDLIEQVLFTTPGERVNRPDFGVGLSQAVFAPNSPELAATLRTLVQGALQQWLARWIDVEGVDIDVEDAVLRVTVSYVVRRTDERRVDVFARAGGEA
jgi:phage baseplate assembly protein W